MIFVLVCYEIFFWLFGVLRVGGSWDVFVRALHVDVCGVGPGGVAELAGD